jgi:hypothetical protein
MRLAGRLLLGMEERRTPHRHVALNTHRRTLLIAASVELLTNIIGKSRKDAFFLTKRAFKCSDSKIESAIASADLCIWECSPPDDPAQRGRAGWLAVTNDTAVGLEEEEQRAADLYCPDYFINCVSKHKRADHK